MYLHANFTSFVLLLAEPKELLATQKYGIPLCVASVLLIIGDILRLRMSFIGVTALSRRGSKSPRYQRRSPSPVQLSSSVLLLPSASTPNTTISDPTG